MDTPYSETNASLRRGPIIAVFALGIILSATIFISMLRWDQSVALQSYDEERERCAGFIQRSLDLNATVLLAVKGLFTASETVTETEFQLFVHQFLLGHPGIHMISWVPPGASEEQELTYTAPASWSNLRKGTKLKDLPRLQSAIEFTTRQTNLHVSPWKEAGISSRYALLTLSVPMRNHDGTAGKTNGVVFAILDQHIAFNQAVQFSRVENHSFSVIDADHNHLLFRSDYSTPLRSSASLCEPHYIISVQFINEKWNVTARSIDNTPPQLSISTGAWITFASGILITLLLSGYVYILSKSSTTARRFAQDQMQSRAAMEKLLTLLQRTQRIAQMGSWALDVPTQKLTWSDETYRIFGMDPAVSTIKYAEFIERCHPDDRELLNKTYADAVEQQSDDYQMDHRIIRFSDGEIRHVHEECNNVKNAAGAVVRSEGIVQDITARIQMMNMVLQSEKMLSVGGLAAGMAHEINNPLAAIVQNAFNLSNRLDTMRDARANVEAAEASGTTMESIHHFMESRDILKIVNSISESGLRAASIVRNMLSFARSSADAITPTPLNSLIERTIELATTDYDIKSAYDFKLIQIDRDFDLELPPVPCESVRMQQVLLNIFQNATHALQEAQTPSPRILIRTRYDKDKERARIEIKDNGPGMKEDVRKRVFEPFFTTKAPGIGTGLGLSVSYFIVTQTHKGNMLVESEPGKGTLFTIELPV